MKKFLLLTALAGIFTLFSFTTAEAQQSIGNRTACVFEVSVSFGFPGCTPAGVFTATVPPFSVVNVPMPLGMVIQRAKGTYASTFCPFYVGLPCSGYPNFVNVPCPAACGPYKALLNSWGVVVFH
ncbi:MAG: hypothetical protein AAGG75_10175 [Bacteroidota bacterium]